MALRHTQEPLPSVRGAGGGEMTSSQIEAEQNRSSLGRQEAAGDRGSHESQSEKRFLVRGQRWGVARAPIGSLIIASLLLAGENPGRRLLDSIITFFILSTCWSILLWFTIAQRDLAISRNKLLLIERGVVKKSVDINDLEKIEVRLSPLIPEISRIQGWFRVDVFPSTMIVPMQTGDSFGTILLGPRKSKHALKKLRDSLPTVQVEEV